MILTVRVDLPGGWYINSNAPLDSFLVAARLEAEAPGLAFGPPRYPKPVIEHSQAMAGNLSLFKEDFEVTLAATGGRNPVSSGKKPPFPGNPDAVPVRVVLHYQSCDGKTCWPPKSVSAVLESGITRRE